MLSVESPGVAPGSSACGADVFLLDHDPMERKPWDLNPQAAFAAACFRNRILIQPDDFRCELRGLESNQRQDVQSVSSCHWTTPQCQTDFEGSGRRNRTLISWFKARQRAVSPSPNVVAKRVSCGSRTRLASLEGWHLCRSANDTCLQAEGEGVEPSRLIAHPFSRRLPSPVGLPFRFKLRRKESNLQLSA